MKIGVVPLLLLTVVFPLLKNMIFRYIIIDCMNSLFNHILFFFLFRLLSTRTQQMNLVLLKTPLMLLKGEQSMLIIVKVRIVLLLSDCFFYLDSYLHKTFLMELLLFSIGAGGGHAPDIIKICSMPNVLPSSTTPTNPFTKFVIVLFFFFFSVLFFIFLTEIRSMSTWI